MGKNQRKTYGYGDGGDSAPVCPNCGCRHFETVRAHADRDGVRVVRVCRNCGTQVTIR